MRGIFNTPMMAGAPDQVRDPLIEMVQYRETSWFTA